MAQVESETPMDQKSDVEESPILSHVSKRIRAAKKKLKRIEDCKERLYSGKALNKDQVQ